MSRLLRAARLATISLAAAALLAGTALARDLCIDDTGNGANPDYVFTKFRLPRPGTCRPFVGFVWPFGANEESSLQGVACAPSSGTIVNFTVTVGRPPNLNPIGGPGDVRFLTMVLQRSNLQGRYSYFVWGSAHVVDSAFAAAYSCNLPGIL